MSRVPELLRNMGDRLLSVDGRRWGRITGWTLVVLLVLDVVLGCYWSREPEPLEPAAVEAPVEGQVLGQALVDVTSTLWEKPGGYLSNDILPHRLWLVRMPAWEQGVLGVSRDLTRVLEQVMGHPKDAESPDKYLSRARTQLHFDAHSWAMPNSRREFERGVRALAAWIERLETGEAVFHKDAAALNAWLYSVQARLDEHTLRLSRQVGQPQGHARAERRRGDHGRRMQEPEERRAADFHETRGSAWALLHLLRAAQSEFTDVLAEKPGARRALRELIIELEATQAPVRSPMVLNGSGFGILANHSMVMAGHASRAHAAAGRARAALAREDEGSTGR